MGSRIWRTLILAAGAVVVAVTTGTAVMAAIDDQDDPPAVQTLDAPAPENPAGDNADVASICIEGATDCDDTIEDGGGAAGSCLVGTPDCVDTPGVGGFEQCATDEPCGDFAERCLPDVPCKDTFSPLAPVPVCPPGMSYEECFPDGTPAGWDCLQLESFPVQVKCYPIGCTTVDGPVTILPAPAEDLPIIVDEPATDPVDPSLVDPGVNIGEPVPAEPIECLPPVDCNVDPIPDECLGGECAISSRQSERCLPPECTTADDGAVACPVPLPTECAPDELCLPPDCAISSDGLTYCPEPMPLPCVEGEGIDGGCSSPGSCGDLGCSGEGYACPKGVTPEECAKIIEEQRRNSGGGTSGTEAIE
jgi:hypothetical protein